jgi:glycosyltransferase involved in cell wall biosynthesis
LKIIIASSFVPFIYGGARFIVEWLQTKLQEHGHQVERFYLPYLEQPDEMLSQILAYRLMDLSESCDRLICFRPPAYVLQHPHKIIWFIHHFRIFYDLWDTQYCHLPHTPKNMALRKALHHIDTTTIAEARRVFTNSQVVADRLRRFNGIDATTLYPPLLNPDDYRNAGYGDEILAVSRMEPHKRQHLLVEAMRHVKTDVRLRLCGASSNRSYPQELRHVISRHALRNVVLEDRWVSQSEKLELIGRALAMAYIPTDEDSYGYPSLEGAHAEKPTLTTSDAGGVLEFVQDGSGLIVPPNPVALAEAMDQLYSDRVRTKQMGLAANHRISDLKIDWPTVVAALTQ